MIKCFMTNMAKNKEKQDSSINILILNNIKSILDNKFK